MLDRNVGEGAIAEQVDQQPAGARSGEARVLAFGEDDDAVAPVDSDVLGPLVLGSAYQLGEARFRVLEGPAPELLGASLRTGLRAGGDRPWATRFDAGTAG